MFLTFDAQAKVQYRHDRITDQGRLRTAVLGPDGDLYVSQDAVSGSILRIHPSG
jgi:glucose/arabinose dehydrogenase